MPVGFGTDDATSNATVAFPWASGLSSPALTGAPGVRNHT